MPTGRTYALTYTATARVEVLPDGRWRTTPDPALPATLARLLLAAAADERCLGNDRAAEALARQAARLTAGGDSDLPGG